MALARDIFYGLASSGFVILVAGTVASPLANCPTSFCLTPALNLSAQIIGLKPVERQETTTNPEATDRPDTTPHHPVLTPDIRLSTCPEGSVEPTAPEVPSTLARSLEGRLKQGVTFRNLVELQAVLGQPRCNFRDGKSIRWRFLIRGGGFVDAVESNGKVNIEVRP